MARPLGQRWRSGTGFQGLRVHMVGVGGCGMFGAARLLQRCGAVVSGSDQRRFDGAGQLVGDGAVVHFCHDAENVSDDVHLVVRSAAVADDNPEIVAARQGNIPVIRYAELLGELMSARVGVSVAGTHGKSTTTGLTTHMFRLSGLAPSFIIGANCRQCGGSSGVGGGPHFIVESCEYARSFLNLRPHSAAILNIEAEHLDCYRDLDDVVSGFQAFAQLIPADGLLVVNHDDRTAKRAARDVACRVETFGHGPGADWRAVNMRARRGSYSFMALHQGEVFAQCTLKLAGAHNVSNALAAMALAHEAGAGVAHIVEALGNYEGVDRRMTVRGTTRGVTVIDDYAHHPTEIRATLRAVRSRYAPRRTWVVFQPHQASRTRLFMDDFSRAFSDADIVLVPDIYYVRDTEEDCRMVSSNRLVERLCLNGKDSRYLPTFEEVTAHLEQNVTAGDVVVTMGAGDVWKVADGLVRRVC